MSTWKDGGASSRVSVWVTVAARFPPELSPAMAGGVSDAPRADASALSHRAAASASSAAAGNGCSGASRHRRGGARSRPRGGRTRDVAVPGAADIRARAACPPARGPRHLRLSTVRRAPAEDGAQRGRPRARLPPSARSPAWLGWLPTDREARELRDQARPWGCTLPLASLDVAAQVPVITGHLASHEELRDWLQHPQHAAQLAAGHEVNPRPLAVGLERPRSVDWVGPFDDVHVDADRPLELGELDDLLELLAARELRALPDTRA